MIGLIGNLRNRVVGCCGQPNKLHATESLGGKTEVEKVTRSTETTGKHKNARKGKSIEPWKENDKLKRKRFDKYRHKDCYVLQVITGSAVLLTPY